MLPAMRGRSKCRRVSRTSFSALQPFTFSSPACVAAGVLILALPALAAPVAPVASVGLTGFVRDTAGRIVVGSVVLAVPVGGEAPLTTTTLDDGRYLFASLAPGAYRITAVKAGYRAGTGSVNTLMKRTLDLVLAPGATDAELAGSSDWMLRVPPRDLLRDTGFTVDTAGSGDTPASDATDAQLQSGVSPARFSLPVNGEVQQWFATGAPEGGSESDAGGNGTLLTLALQVSERLALSVDGERERSDTQIALAGEPTASAMGADRVGVTVGYDLGGESRLDLQASYRRNSLLLDDEPVDWSGSTDNESVTRACSTNWRTELGSAGRLALSALYVDEVSRGTDDAQGVAIEPATSRLLRASGLYRAPVGSDHMISLGVRARMYETDLAWEDSGMPSTPLSPLSDGSPLALAGPAPPGWALHLHGDEEWTLTPTLGLDFGIDYLRSLSVRESSSLVPQAGATWRPGASTAVKGEVSWLADSYAGSTDGQPGLPVSRDEPSRFGYALGVEQRAGEKTVLAARASEQPLAYQYDIAEPFPARVSDRPLYISDGQARSRQAEVEVRRRFGSISTSAGVEWGEIDGLYAVALPGEPLRDMHQGELHYRVTSFTTSTRDGETEARLEIRTLSEADPDADVPDGEGRILTLTVSQALDFVQLGATRWRLLLAWQDCLDHGPGDDDQGEGWFRAEDRVSGGVSVRF